MFWSTSTKPLLDERTERWQLDCWRWLIDGLAPGRNLHANPLILPTVDFFPATDAAGHDMAEHLFRHVAELSGVADWPFDLVAQEWHPDDVPDTTAHLSYAAGTYTEEPGGRMTIGYYPGLVEKPLDLIGMFAHEVSHGIVRTIDRPPPGSWQMEEFAVELATVYLGFGLFGANNAFQVGFGWSLKALYGSWSWSSSGYLSQEQWAFALAVFLELRGETGEEVKDWLKPPLARMFKQAQAYLEENPDRLAGLRT
ncbi:MAG: hypothetical protein ACR2PM_06615 [Hyphomicrobiales bacterium]